MQLELLYVKLLKQQNYENIQTYKGRTKYPNSCTIRIRKQDEIAKNQKRREKSNDAKVQTIKKVGDKDRLSKCYKQTLKRASKRSRSKSRKSKQKVGDELPYSITPNADKKAIETPTNKSKVIITSQTAKHQSIIFFAIQQLFSIINVIVHRFIIHRRLFLNE